VIAMRVSRTGLTAVLICVALGAVFAGGAAPAWASSSAWWHLTVGPRPTVVNGGLAQDEVQTLTVNATGGVYAVGRDEAPEAFVPFNATPAELQATLEGVYGANNVMVTEGEGDEKGDKPYRVVFTGALADDRVRPMYANSVLFGNLLTCAGATSGLCKASASVAVASVGRPDGQVVVSATNLGYTDVNATTSPVEIGVKLPAGMEAAGIEGVAGHIVNSALATLECSVGSLSCVFRGSVTPYEQLTVIVRVVVKPGAQSGEVAQAAISGGEAPATSATSPPIAVAGGPTPFGVEAYEMTPEEAGGGQDTQAGSHPFQLTTTLNLNQSFEINEKFGETPEPAEMAKDLSFKLPPGLIGNPTPFPQCTLAQFLTPAPGGSGENLCPPQTAVGVARVSFVEAQFLGYEMIIVPLFNLEPSVGEPARFGFLPVGTPVFLDTAVRTGGDYGVTVNVDNITQTVGFMKSEVTFWGVPGDPRHGAERGWNCLYATQERASSQCNPPEEHAPPPLLSLPTSCTGPLQTSVEADSWVQEGNFLSKPATVPLPAMDGCNRLPFEPSINLTPDGQAGSTPTGLAVSVHVPQSVSLAPEGLAEADVKNTTVTLPEGVAINPAGADGLQACSEEQIALPSAEPPTCPEASKIGLVKIKTPLLPNPLEGAAYLAQQNTNPFGSLVAMYVFVEDPISGSRVKLAGEVVPNPVTGQLVSTFKNTPQLPFETFELHFFGGDRAPLATPAKCGAYTTTASIEPWTETGEVASSSTFDVVSGPNGSSCRNPLSFQPSLTVGTTSIQAGGFTPFTMTMSREDGEQPLQGIALHMPKGVSGTLSHVKLCGEQQADEGTCGPESEIGETIVSVGVGGDPYTVKGGKVYITGPYKGAPFGLSIVNPAKAGPYNLGQVVVRAKLEVDKETAAITVTTDNEGPYKIPTIIDGIPLQIKHVNVNINRPGFTFNSTNCSPLQITGELVSTEGATSTLQVPYQVTNCAVLAFKPKLEASTTGKTSRANGASFHVKLGYPAGPYDANIARVKVELPKALPSRLTTLQKACTAAVFNANPAACPAASIVGHATAVTPVLPVPLSGPAYFVSHGGEAFPSLIIVLQGYGVTVHLVGSTFINRAGVTSSTFKTVPDVPVGTFELTLPQGQFSALAATGNFCKQKLAMPTEFLGQNGALIKTSTKIAVTGCGKAKKTKHRGKKASKRHGDRRGVKGKGRKK
jgi:hypothetical protein